MTKLSNTQEDAVDKVASWFKFKQEPIFRVFGFAGTGKTFLANYFAEGIEGTTVYAAYTGKAALNMRKSGCTGATTIHSLIYDTQVDDLGNFHFDRKPKSMLDGISLIVIDECSMVNDEMASDLLSFNIPILVLGDPAQLPPVNGEGFFTREHPDVMLTEIHRQAKDNPIIHMSKIVREGRKLPYGSYGESVVMDKLRKEDIMNFDQVITGKIETKNKINSIVRSKLDHDTDLPCVGEKLICTRNDRQKNIMNGGMFRPVSRPIVAGGYFNQTMKNEDTGHTVYVRIHCSQFIDDIPEPSWKAMKGTQYFDFGYAITCHKSQGSQWPSVYTYDQSNVFGSESSRWLYTAITRAEEKQMIFRKN